MEAVTTYSQSFFGWLLQTTLIASLVICLILLIQKLLGGRLGPRWSYALWLVLLIRMILPWSPSSRVSLSNLIPSWQRQTQSLPLPDSVGQQSVSVPTQTSKTSEEIAVQEPQNELAAEKQSTPKPRTVANAKAQPRPRLVLLRRILPILWLAGAIVIGAYLLVSDLALWRIVKRDRPLVNQAMLELFEECKSQMGVQSLVVVVPSDQVRNPGLFGFIRPRLLLPRQMLDTATTEEMRYVFLHELAHLRRHDIYLGWLTSLLQVLHWFNPLVWFAFYRMRADRELACDALVLTCTGQEKSQEYGGAIVELVKRFSRSRLLPAMAGIIESKSQLKRRIAMITKFRNKSYRFSPLAAVLIIILASISLPDAKRTDASETQASPPANQPKFTKIRIPTKPGGGVLSPDGQRLAYISEGSLWTVPVHGKVSPDIAGEPVRLTEPMGAWDVASMLAWSADGKWIAFNTSDEKGDAIYVIASSGGEPRRVPVEPRLRNSVYNYRLSLSPDGKVVAFSSRYINESGAEPPEEPGLPPSVRGFFIYTVPVAGGQVKRLTDSSSGEPAFSPDGKMIAFVKYYISEEGPLYGSAWVVPATGGSPVQVSQPDPQRRVGGPVWSPDGRMIAYTARTESERKEVFVVPVSETGRAVASPTKIRLPLNTLDFLTGWTRDNRIGVFLQEPGSWAIHTVPASGGQAVQVTPSGSAAHPQWSPDGRRIYFRWDGGQMANVPSGGGQLSIGPLDSDETFYLIYPGCGNAVCPDGKEIVFCAGKRISPENKEPYWEVNVYTIPVKGGEPRKIVQNGRYPCWAPDGKSIAFIRTYERPVKRESGWNIYIVPSKGGDARQLTSDSDDVRRTHIDWSPDGKSIAYFAKDKTLRVIPVKGGKPRIVATAEELRNHDAVSWSPDGGKLVYSSKGSIWAVSSDGGEPTEISTGLDEKAGHVCFSPDGKKLAFTGMATGEEDLYLIENFLPTTAVAESEPMTTVRKIGYEWRGPYANLSPDGRYMSDRDWNTGTLIVRELVTGKSRTLVGRDSHVAGFPLVSAISPDSKEVAYLWLAPNKKDSSLNIVSFEGADHRVLCKGKWLMPRKWSSDGQKILALVEENDVWQMVWLSVSNGSLEHIAPVGTSYPGKVDISPDGRFIAYDRPQDEDNSKRDIFVFDLHENRELSVVKHPANDKLLGWTPDGRYIFFASDRTGTWDAWLQPVAEGKPRGFPELARHGIGNITPIGFTPDGSYYYGYEQTLEDVFIARLDLETGKVLSEPTPVLQTGSTDCHDWSPNGQYLAYCERHSDKSRTIHIRTLATGREWTLSDNLPFIRWLRWSPDNRSFLIDGYKRGGSRGAIFKIDARTGERTDLVRSPNEILIRPEMSPDGKTLFYTRGNNPRSGTVRLMARDLKSGHEKELFRAEAPARLAGSALSPDGKRIVLSIVPGQTGPEGPVLKILSTVDGQLRELLQFKKSENLRAVGVTWMPDSRNVLFWKWFQGDKELELYRVSAEGGEPRKLWSRKALGHMRVNPDGQHIAFYDRSTTRAVWVMESFLPEAIAMGK